MKDMTITEFAKGRDVEPQTVSRYIARHTEVFKGHVSKKGKVQELDEKALEILEKKYPLPKPVTVLKGVPEAEHYEALAEKDRQIQRLQEYVIELQKQQNETIKALATAEASQLLLESHEASLEAELNSFHKTIFGLYKKS